MHFGWRDVFAALGQQLVDVTAPIAAAWPLLVASSNSGQIAVSRTPGVLFLASALPVRLVVFQPVASQVLSVASFQVRLPVSVAPLVFVAYQAPNLFLVLLVGGSGGLWD